MHESVEEIKARVKEAQKRYNADLNTIDTLLISKRGYEAKKPVDQDVVVLYSGGLDSTIMIDKIINDWNVQVHPLFIKRGAKAEKFEEEAFDYFIDYFQKKYPNNMHEGKKIEYEVPPKDFKDSFPKEYLQTIGHPLRNSTMENLAVMYAIGLNNTKGLFINTVLVGSVGDDSTEPEQGILSLRSQTLNTCINLGNWNWQITSPFTDPALVERPIYKHELIEYSIKKQIPIEKTRSCFSDQKEPDKTCIACVKREKALEIAIYNGKDELS